jgi:opacity protein-like surface antigen
VRALAAGLALGAALALGLAPGTAPPAQAREGIYAGLGFSGLSFADGLDGTRTIDDGTYEVRVGKPDSANGLTFNGGLGFNDYVALDLLVTVSDHDTVFDPGGSAEPYPATLNSVLLGVRAGMPLGDVAEVFGRIGMGGYELTYSGNNIQLPATSIDGARLSGRGFAWGLGAEVFFERWGLQLAYTVHNVDFDTVVSQNFPGPVSPEIGATLTAVSVVFNYYLH